MTDPLTCENSTVITELGYRAEGEDPYGVGNEEQEGSSTPQVETMRIQEDQERNEDRKHEENARRSCWNDQRASYV